MSSAVAKDEAINVSVLMITYNHERFIAQSIESVLMQLVAFKCEIVIGEDCSTDGTRSIICDFQRRYPDRIRLLPPETNMGMNKNFVQTLRACRGQYIATLEGDDFWTSPLKLQKQVDFLDSHPECTICFHDALISHEDGSRLARSCCPPNQKEISSLDDLLVTNFIPACSVMFRNGLTGGLPDWFSETAMADWALHVLNALHGKIGYINELMSVYRIHPGGVWSGQSEITRLEGILDLYDKVFALVDLPPSARAAQSQAYGRVHWQAGLCLVEAGQLSTALGHFEQAIVQYSVLDLEPDFALKQLLHTSTGLRPAHQLAWILEVIPNDQSRRRGFKRHALGQYHGIKCFEAYQGVQPSVIRRHLPLALWWNPSWLRNRGLLRIGLWAYARRG